MIINARTFFIKKPKRDYVKKYKDIIYYLWGPQIISDCLLKLNSQHKH